MRTVVDDKLGKTIYADNIKLVKGKVTETPRGSLNKAGLQILAVDRSDLYSQLRLMGSDSIITPVEKRSLDREWKSLIASKAATIQKVDEYSIGDHTITLTMLNAYDELENYLNIVLDPTKMGENTDITELGSPIAFFEDYYTKKTALDEMLFRLETGMLSGMDYRTKFTVEVISSTGVTVPVDGTPSILRVALFQEGVEATDNYLDSEFTWHRITTDRELDALWRADQNLTGKTLSVTKDDLINKAASFGCTFRHVYSDTMYFEKFGYASLSEEVPGKDGADVYQVQVISDKGTVFRMGQPFSTTFTVRVWKGGEEITHLFSDEDFRWTRTSNDHHSDELWNSAHYSTGGKSLIVTNADTVGKSNFFCELLTKRS